VHLTFVEQYEQLGTGHAVSVALPTIEDEGGVTDGDVLILPGDTPLLRSATVGALLAAHRESQAALTVLTAIVDDPSGYGRVVRAKDGTVARIIEERDATSAELDDAPEAQGVNDRMQLAQAEAVLRSRINERWMKRGVTMWDPGHTYVDADVVLGTEVSLLPGCVLKGHCIVQKGAQIGPNATLSDVYVGENAKVGMVEATNARIGADATVHSFVVLMPGARIANAEVVVPFEYRTR